MDDDGNGGVAQAIRQQVVTFDRPSPPTTIPPDTVRRRGPVRALCGVLIVCLAAFVVGKLAPSDLGKPATPADAGQLSDLDSDTAQQTTATQLAAAVAAMSGSAPAAQVSAACSLADQMTRPLTPDVDRWVTANCVADQEPHDGPRYDVGPLSRA